MIDYKYNDGGRSDSGRTGRTGDCTARALAILTGRPYDECYQVLAEANALAGHARSVRGGVSTEVMDRVFRRQFGLTRVKLPKGSRPTYSEAYDLFGNCIVKTTRHVAALVDGALQDTSDGRTYFWPENILVGGVLTQVATTKQRKASRVYVVKKGGT